MKLLDCSLLLICMTLSPVRFVAAQENNNVQMPVKVSIPTVSLVGFAGSNTQLNDIPGKGTVQRIKPTTKDTTWLNYSSVIDGNSYNTISVNITSGNLPAEAVVRLIVGEDVGAGAGTMGKPVSEVALSEYPQAVITDIGTCFTGIGSKKGHPLTYSWEGLPDYDANHPITENIEISVIYTFTTGK